MLDAEKLKKKELKINIFFKLQDSLLFNKFKDPRISKSIYIEDLLDKELLNLNKLVSSITNLSITINDGWQVVNYGIGGHVVPHFDFTTVINFLENSWRKILFLLIYQYKNYLIYVQFKI